MHDIYCSCSWGHMIFLSREVCSLFGEVVNRSFTVVLIQSIYTNCKLPHLPGADAETSPRCRC